MSKRGIPLSVADFPVPQPLLDLYGALSPEQFRDAVSSIIRDCMPLNFLCACLFFSRLQPSYISRDRRHFTSPRHFQNYYIHNPLSGYVAQNPGCRIFRLSDMFSADELHAGDFYKICLEPDDTEYIANLCFWQKSTMLAMISLHRSRGQGDFTATEMRTLKKLYPHLESAVLRLSQLTRERSAHLSLEKLLQRMPSSSILLNWDLEPYYSHSNARDLCEQWVLGRDQVRMHKRSRTPKMPEEILSACKELRTSLEQSCTAEDRLTLPRGREVVCGTDSSLRAEITPLQLQSQVQGMPSFLVQIHRESSATVPASTAPSVVEPLSSREREVLELLREGRSNDEIAQMLCKSVHTVKSQVRSILVKFDTPTRNRLVALLNGSTSTQV